MPLFVMAQHNIIFSAAVFLVCQFYNWKEAKKITHRSMGDCRHISTHRSSFSTLPLGRLLCGHRACPLRTPYRLPILYNIFGVLSTVFLKVDFFIMWIINYHLLFHKKVLKKGWGSSIILIGEIIVQSKIH